jgi:hypothetical protein
MLETHPGGRAHICFAPDRESVTGGKSCPPGFVIEGLATGVYRELLEPLEIRPQDVAFREHIPAMTFGGPTWMDRLETKPLWRLALLDWAGEKYVLARLLEQETVLPTSRDTMFDETLTGGVPRLIQQLPLLPPTQTRELNLRPYTERPASAAPRRQVNIPGYN